jgi:hypothetical protein
LSFFPLFPLAAGSVVIGRRSAGAEAFFFGGIALLDMFCGFFL